MGKITMSIFKCKMCGGTLSVQDGATVAECEYCGTTQTVPTSNDEVIVNLFNRANNLRLKSEYDKAAEVYEKILDLDNTQAEAHWGVVLCKYGVEYVEDPLTKERIPTCHRTQMTSLLTDADYLAVLQYADSASRSVYEEQAAAINELQKRILEIVKSEKPFDVFICYKETDESGARTKDSVIANEIYHELTNSGLKVFFAAITLEDKLGQEYEPYIFAALTSAKVMLVLGTKTEYFNAVWVKNEWSRYLHLMKSDRKTKRTLIPCYRDMDAYDLPDEFSHLQALDMANIAFLPDLSRNIKKLIGVEVVAGTIPEERSQAIDPLLRRAFMFLEDGEFDRADELLEMVLDHDPENAKSYLGKLMVKLRVHTEEELMQYSSAISEDPHFKKACRFADDEFRAVLLGYNQAILDRALEEKYHTAKKALQSGEYEEANELFKEISLHLTAPDNQNNTGNITVQMIYDAALELMELKQYETASKIFKTLNNYSDSEERAVQCHEHSIQALYDEASTLMEEEKYDEASGIFGKISDYRDAATLQKECMYQRAKELAFYGNYNRAIQSLQPICDDDGAKELIHSYQNALDKLKKDYSKMGNIRRRLPYYVVFMLIWLFILSSAIALNFDTWVPVVIVIVGAIGTFLFLR